MKDGAFGFVMGIFLAVLIGIPIYQTAVRSERDDAFEKGRCEAGLYEYRLSPHTGKPVVMPSKLRDDLNEYLREKEHERLRKRLPPWVKIKPAPPAEPE